MAKLEEDIFVCLDCESTGLDPKNDLIIEVAVAIFKGDKILDQYETLVNPKVTIPKESIKIHHISQKMVEGKPTIDQVLPKVLEMVGDLIIVGHGIPYDIALIDAEAKRHQIPCQITKNQYIDTLRLARAYGKSPTNSLEMLRKHYNIDDEGAHRAMSDVIVNIEVFKKLAKEYKTTQAILDRLKKPVAMQTMPLGKHKGRDFKEIPFAYLQWASHQKFDRDLLYSIRKELARRKKGKGFLQSTNPFSNL